MTKSLISEKEEMRMIYRKMLKEYYRNIGEYSEYAETLITPSLIVTVERRYIQLGGDIESLYAILRKKN
jgi:hypothetical protein